MINLKIFIILFIYIFQRINIFFQKYFKYILTFLLIISSLLLSIFYLNLSFQRLITSFKDLISSLIYSFSSLFNLKTNIKPSILDMPKYNIFPRVNNNNQNNIVTPQNKDYNVFNKFNKFFDLFFNDKNFISYIEKVLSISLIIIQIAMIFALFFFIIYLILNFREKKVIVDPFKKSKLFIYFQKNILPKIEFINISIKNTVLYIKNNKIIKMYFIFWFLLSFNLITILIEFFSYYIYLISSFNLSSTFSYQIYKLSFDLSIYFKKIPIFFHIVFSYLIFIYIRKELGYQKLKQNEVKNKNFINDMPIISMFNGSMGTSKTTMLSDISISKSEIFRNKALSFILDIRKKYPDFNFNLFDNLIIFSIEEEIIYSCFSAEKNYSTLIEDYKKELNYDSFYFDNSLIISSLDDDLISYIKLMLIYIINSNLIFSNYSIRLDKTLTSLGNFPLHNFSYFKRKSYFKNENDIFSHIVDFDLLRLGKRLEKNKHNFDFGIFSLTEIGKERGNQLTQQGLKKDDKEVNQKNDNFNSFVKLIRHYSTICNYPFCFFICDDQRSESVNADLKELMYLYKIEKNKKKKLAIPFYSFENLLSEIILDKYNYKILDRIYRRSDTTLYYYLINKFIYFIYKRHLFYTNTFSYIKMSLLEEEAANKINKKNKEYYLSFKKIFSKRFSTDAYSDYFKKEKELSEKGILSYRKYKDTKASQEELNYQNSFLIKELEKIQGEEKDENN